MTIEEREERLKILGNTPPNNITHLMWYHCYEDAMFFLSEVKRLREGIEKHMYDKHGWYMPEDPFDRELYKLLGDK